MRNMRRALAAVLLLSPVVCAQTFLVDAANGPGTHFTDLPTAVAAVPDGAVLRVRAGSYSGFSVAGKGLTILGFGGGVVITSPISIANTQSHQAITLRELSWLPAHLVLGDRLLELSNCSGSVLLERIMQPPSGITGLTGPFGVYATSCPRLHLRECTILCTMRLDFCTATLETCTITGENIPPTHGLTTGRTALRLWYSNAQISGGSVIQGGNGWPYGLGVAPAGHGIHVSSGAVRVLDGQVGGGSNSPFPGFTIIGTSSGPPQISPRVTLLGIGGPQVGLDVMPALVGASAPSGGAMTATVVTETGDLVVLAVGLPGPALFKYQMQDPFFLDPLVHEFTAIGVQQAGVPVASSILVPAGPAFLGFRLNWQAACYGPVTGFQATNPVALVVH